MALHPDFPESRHTAPGPAVRGCPADEAPRENEPREWNEATSGGDFVENDRQSFRVKKDRSLELVSTAHECSSGRRKIAVKVASIFGIDTMTIVEVTV